MLAGTRRFLGRGRRFLGRCRSRLVGKLHRLAYGPTVTAAPLANPPLPTDETWSGVAADLFDLRDVASGLTPTDEIGRQLSLDKRGMTRNDLGRNAEALIAAIPPGVRHLVLVPWLGLSGGSEKVTERTLLFLKEYYPAGEVCILGLDSGFMAPEEVRTRVGLPVVAINDTLPNLSDDERVLLLDRVMIECRPATVHCINSWVGWQTFREYGAFYGRDSRLFVNIYSDIRLSDGFPIGYFWNYLPNMLHVLDGVFADNGTVIKRASEAFGLTRSDLSRFHVLRTPVLGLEKGHVDPPLPAIPHGPKPQRTLWMSRIANEKRIDVLAAVAARAGDRTFDIYGAILSVSAPVDMSWTDALPNVCYRGRYESLSDLPLDSYDSYLFTTSGEGMPISLLEVAMLGLPIIAPHVGGIGEIIGEDTGWLVSGPDAVDEYLAALEHIRRDPEEARRRALAARRLIEERHSWAAFSATIKGVPGYLQSSAGTKAACL